MATRRRKPAEQQCPQEWTAGVEWFRYRVDGPGAVRDAWRAALDIQAEDIKAGSPVRQWSFKGYVGKATDRIRWGRRGSTLIWETSGAWADSTWRLMPLCGGRATRIDLHSTVLLSQPQPGYGMRCLPPEATTPPHRLPSGKPVGLQWGADGMWLGTVGRRTCPEYLRLYDKGVEQRLLGSGRMWRLELEVKYAQAEALCREEARSMLDPRWVASYVTSRWLSSGLLWPLRHDVQCLAAVRAAPKPESTSPALLAWMNRSVAPVVSRLLRTTPLDDILLSLGLLTAVELRRPNDAGSAGAEGDPA